MREYVKLVNGDATVRINCHPYKPAEKSGKTFAVLYYVVEPSELSTDIAIGRDAWTAEVNTSPHSNSEGLVDSDSAESIHSDASAINESRLQDSKHPCQHFLLAY